MKNFFNSNHHTEGPPCKTMESLIQELASGNLTGWGRWYAAAHAARCYRCGNFLQRMKITIVAIKSSKSEPSEAATHRMKNLIQELDAK